MGPKAKGGAPAIEGPLGKLVADYRLMCRALNAPEVPRLSQRLQALALAAEAAAAPAGKGGKGGGKGGAAEAAPPGELEFASAAASGGYS